MSLQRNVAQQNADAQVEIRRIAAGFAENALASEWLRQALKSASLNSAEGCLVALSSIPGSEGEICFGTWITLCREFWTFEILRKKSGEVVVDCLENVTATTVVSAHVAGTGKSFGQLAVEVLREFHPELVVAESFAVAGFGAAVFFENPPTGLAGGKALRVVVFAPQGTARRAQAIVQFARKVPPGEVIALQLPDLTPEDVPQGSRVVIVEDVHED